MTKNMFNSMFGAALDFLFPANDSVQKFENADAADLVKMLPPSEMPNEPFEKVSTLFAYSDEHVKHLVWEIKYYRNKKVTDSVGALLAQKIKERVIKNTAESQTDLRKNPSGPAEQILIVPIPLTRRRLRERGYNHTELLAKSILKNLLEKEGKENFVLAVDVLKKIRHTPKQHSIENREDRFTNIAGAFEVPARQHDFVKNAHVLIIDDVVTTGATIQEATRALLSAGAKSVEVFAVAH